VYQLVLKPEVYPDFEKKREKIELVEFYTIAPKLVSREKIVRLPNKCMFRPPVVTMLLPSSF
jgi:hypothetical protein